MATAGIGVLMIGLLVAWGTAYGTWLDEIGPFIDDAGAAPDAPTIVLPVSWGCSLSRSSSAEPSSRSRRGRSASRAGAEVRRL